MKYNPGKIEKKWQHYWEAKKFYHTKEGKDNFMLLTEFAYPSGNLHIGHWLAFSVPDILARYLKMTGNNVLYSTGFDAFGLPAENAAIQRNINPRDWTEDNIKQMTKQLKSIGAMFDWSRKVSTIDPEYYKWTQWMFLKMYEKGLAYREKTFVNWCPKDKTVLANEQVKDGRCDRCGTEVEQKELFQWMFKITDYADKLIDDLEKADYPETVRVAQRNWIGRSEGAIIKFPIFNSKFSNGGQDYVEVFTTRADTLFGATYLVLAPEHPMVMKLTKDENLNVVNKYLEEVKKKTEMERLHIDKSKTGVDTGGYVVNPVNNEKIPVWVADYVIGWYGTGAVMAVPAHDERDFEFAKKFNLPIKPVVLKKTERSYSYVMGVNEEDLKKVGVEIIEKTKNGFFKIKIPFEKLDSYKEFIKQWMKPNFWNEFYTPNGFYFIFKHKEGRLEELELNENTNDLIDKYGMTFNNEEPNENPKNVYGWLAENDFYKEILIHQDVGVLINSGKFDGMDSKEAQNKIVEKLKEKGLAEFKKNYKLHDWVLSRQRYWGVPIPMIHCDKCNYQPVLEKDLPVELPELEDFKPTDDGRSPLAKAEGWVNAKCPKCGQDAKRETDTMDTFVDSSWYFLRYADPKNKKEFAGKAKLKAWLPVPLYIGGAEHNTMHLLYSRFITKALHDLGYLDFDEPFSARRNHGIILGPDNQKMSKSRGNVVDPDIEVKKYGADTIRMYLAFMGPYDQGGPWNTDGIQGVFRFLNRVWNFMDKPVEPKTSDKEVDRILNKSTKEIGDDIRDLKFNTGVSGLMKLLNAVESKWLTKKQYGTFLKFLAPFAPHLAEELWRTVLKNKKSIHLESWPKYDESILAEDLITLVLQVNGKLRGSVRVKKGLSEDEAKGIALSNEKIKKHLESREPKKYIYVRDRLLNLVV